jgi:hypothetical protein
MDPTLIAILLFGAAPVAVLATAALVALMWRDDR